MGCSCRWRPAAWPAQCRGCGGWVCNQCRSFPVWNGTPLLDDLKIDRLGPVAMHGREAFEYEDTSTYVCFHCYEYFLEDAARKVSDSAQGKAEDDADAPLLVLNKPLATRGELLQAQMIESIEREYRVRSKAMDEEYKDKLVMAKLKASLQAKTAKVEQLRATTYLPGEDREKVKQALFESRRMSADQELEEAEIQLALEESRRSSVGKAEDIGQEEEKGGGGNVGRGGAAANKKGDDDDDDDDDNEEQRNEVAAHAFQAASSYAQLTRRVMNTIREHRLCVHEPLDHGTRPLSILRERREARLQDAVAESQARHELHLAEKRAGYEHQLGAADEGLQRAREIHRARIQQLKEEKAARDREIEQRERKRREELKAQEAAGDEYVRHHTKACPVCKARGEKDPGCNVTTCSNCQRVRGRPTFFCWTCLLVLKGPDGKAAHDDPHWDTGECELFGD